MAFIRPPAAAGDRPDPGDGAEALLLDETAAGMNESERLVVAISRVGTTVLVEQNARHALAMATYAYVLETG